MSYAIVWTVAFLASGLTFFSGFGLGTLLLPAFLLFFPAGMAVALAAIVHFLNGMFKLFLVWRNIDWTVLLRFGAPAVLGALVGSWILVSVADWDTFVRYSIFGREVEITAVKLIVGILLLLFACAELFPVFRRFSFPARYQPLGGLLSGFFGGLAGMQGALRSAFLIKAGLDKEAYVATGSAIGFVIDVSRLAIYTRLIAAHHQDFDYLLLGGAIFAAFAGAALGNHYLPKATLVGIQGIVAVLLFAVATGLVLGLI
jgi:uncharacterized protein